MSTVQSASARVATSTAAITDMIAAIEADLSRIVQSLDDARRSEHSGVADTACILARLAVIKSGTGRVADGLAAMRYEMTPLALLSLQSEQLTLIKGIDGDAARLLNNNGLHRFADIAALMPEDVKELGRHLGDRRRIARQGWIEQAALLAAGIDTVHATRVRAGEFASHAATPAHAQQHEVKTVSVHADTTATAKAAIPTAAVIDLAGQRSDRSRKSSSLAQVGGMTLAAALVLALTLNAGTIAGMAWNSGGKTTCSPSGAGLAAGKCTFAQLP